MSVNNIDVFMGGIQKLKKAMRPQLLGLLEKVAYRLLSDVESQKEYHNLTGNTLTSYMVGIYEGKNLSRIVSIYDIDNLDQPTRTKLTQAPGWSRKFIDYDTGRLIMVRTSDFVKTDEGYGYDSSKRFLMDYIPNNGNAFTLVICTGTEYSEYLENTKGLNVLTESMSYVDRIVLNNIQPIEIR